MVRRTYPGDWHPSAGPVWGPPRWVASHQVVVLYTVAAATHGRVNGMRIGGRRMVGPVRSVSPDHILPPGTTQSNVSLRPVPTSAGLARHFVASTLIHWGLEDLVDVASLLVSELVTNTILHARCDLEVSITAGNQRIRVSVRDSSPLVPELRTASLTATTGRGLALVEACASCWGVDVDASGKCVWFDLAA